jgi:antitoxin StbD
MANDFTQVLPTSQARAELSAAVARFRSEGVSSAPVVFGSHRKPEGVVLPFELFEQLIPAIEDILLAATIRARLANPAPSVPLEDVIEELGFSPAEFE